MGEVPKGKTSIITLQAVFENQRNGQDKHQSECTVNCSSFMAPHCQIEAGVFRAPPVCLVLSFLSLSVCMCVFSPDCRCRDLSSLEWSLSFIIIYYLYLFGLVVYF